MVFVTHDEQQEINGFFATNPYEHTDKYFEINTEMAIEMEYRFRYSNNGYLIYDEENHQAKGLFEAKTDKQKYARLGYVGLPQLILKATENLEEAKQDLEKVYQARIALRNLRKKYLNS